MGNMHAGTLEGFILCFVVEDDFTQSGENGCILFLYNMPGPH